MADLTGLRVFVVEDEGAVALMIEDMLEALGCEIAASVARFPEARKLATEVDADIAVLDVNLDGRLIFPVAAILRQRKIPIVFSTGYGTGGLPDEFNGMPVLGKPFSITELQRAIGAALR